MNENIVQWKFKMKSNIGNKDNLYKVWKYTEEALEAEIIIKSQILFIFKTLFKTNPRVVQEIQTIPQQFRNISKIVKSKRNVCNIWWN